MAIQKKVFERVLNMAQMHNIGVLHRSPDMLWTCKWNEGGAESSICYQIQKNAEDKSAAMRLRYRVLGLHTNEPDLMDYTVPIKVSLSYKRKIWYWFVCPLIINGKPCAKRVRNLYFLPSSNYFGCKSCRDLMIRSLPPAEQFLFRQTQFLNLEEQRRQAPHVNPELQMGWRPAGSRELCQSCGCLSEGEFCCHCGATLDQRKSETFYDLLGIRPNTPEEEIQAAFKNRIKEYHPDRVAHLGKKLQMLAEREIKQINIAYDVLKDPDRRIAYLREIESREIRS